MSAGAVRLAALKMLARRELSEAQLRSRLLRLGHEPPLVDETLDRLRADRAVDDARVAAAIARTESGVRGRGPQRVRQRLAAAGIARDVADRAVAEAFAQVDEDALIRAALEKRLGSHPLPRDPKELARLYRHLIRRGFSPEQVRRVLGEV